MALGRRVARLNENDERVLAVAQLNAEFSISQIANLSGLKTNVVRHSLSKLINEGMVQRFWYINVYALGHTIYTLYFTLAASNSVARTQLVDYLADQPLVVFFFETAGQYDFGLSVQATSVEEFASFMAALGERFGECFRSRSTAILMSLTDYPLVKSFQSPAVVKSLRIGNPVKTCQIDPLDEKIIEALTKNPMLSLQAIARMIGQPYNTLSYRFARLKREGVLVGSRLFLDYLRLGLSFSGHQITLAGCSSADMEKMERFFADHPLVYYMERCIGPWDFEIGTILFEPGDASRFSKDVMEKFGKSIARIDTFAICAFLKLNGTRYVNGDLAKTAY